MVIDILVGVLLGTGVSTAGTRLLRSLDRPVPVSARGCALVLAAAGAGAGVAAPVVGVPAAAAVGAFGGWCLLLAAADLTALRLPDVLTVPGALGVLGFAAATGHVAGAVAGAVALGGLHLLVRLVAPAALGAGDVKLAFGLGAATGACGVDPWLLGALGAPVVTALVGVVVLAVRRPGRGHALPHGPGMCLAAWLAVATAIT